MGSFVGGGDGREGGVRGRDEGEVRLFVCWGIVAYFLKPRGECWVGGMRWFALGIGWDGVVLMREEGGKSSEGEACTLCERE